MFRWSAILLLPASIFLGFSYAGPEPFFEYRSENVLAFIGLATAGIAFWLAWSLGIVVLVIAGVLRRRWLFALLAAAIGLYVLLPTVGGYLFDLEHFMLSAEQQKRLGIPPLE